MVQMFVFIAIILISSIQTSFKQNQLKNSRVKTAYEEKEAIVKSFFAEKKIRYEGYELFIRAFKKEQVVEVWVKEKNKDEFVLLHAYPFCATSGTLGPKRSEGDSQIPEGVYEINHFNPQSNFYLSLGINYPNASDKILSDRQHPGGSIYIHGNCVTIGCISITDDKIKELYVLAVEAKNNGQGKISVHIFPDRLDTNAIEKLSSSNQTITSFWKNLQPIYEDFKSSRKLKVVSVNSKGEYSIKN